MKNNGKKEGIEVKVVYPIDCYERDLILTFPDGYKLYEKEILSCLDDYYYKWTHVEEIEDPDERDYVHDSCCEEYMMECLSEIYNQWDEWESKEWEEE